MRRKAFEEGRRLLDQATEDLYWAHDLAERGGYHIACFLAQQVGGKALKAFFYAQGEAVVLRHSIERLCIAATRWQPAFREKGEQWSIFDSYYVSTRYSNSFPIASPPSSIPKRQPRRLYY